MDKYEYFNLEGDSGQYDDVQLIPGRAVDARYIKSPLIEERGNRLIEALPVPRINRKSWINAYTRGIVGFVTDPTDKSDFQKFREIGLLRDIRFPLPFSWDLEMDFYRAMVESYNARQTIKGTRYEIRIGDSKCCQTFITAPKRNGAVIGFSLIGKSQTGKTSAIRILTSRYPPLIKHTLSDGSCSYQIPYIIAECQIRASIRAVYKSIGSEIDKICGNENPYYETSLGGSRTSLAEKEQRLKTIINNFGVGVLILEEIQNMNFDSEDEKSFESFLTLCNETGIALVVVGTEDARNKMFQTKERTAHRVGPEIRSDLYCENAKFMYEIVTQLCVYQWFDAKFEIDKKTAGALLHYSCGIIGLLVRIYMYMCIDYVTKSGNKKPVINEKYVETIVKRRFSGIVDLLKEHHSGLSDEAIQSYVESLDSAFDEEKASAENQVKVMNELSEQTTKIIKNRKLKDYILNRVLEYDDYDKRVVEQLIDNFIADGSFEGINDVSCLRKVLERLKSLDSQYSGYGEDIGDDNKNVNTAESPTEAPTMKKGDAKKKQAADKETIEKFREEIKKKMPDKPFAQNSESIN